MEINEIADIFGPVTRTPPTAGPTTVFDPRRDFPGYSTAPSPEWSRALESVAPGMTNLLQSQSAIGETWEQTWQRVMPAIAATVQQREILKIQLERARQGLPPLDNSQFGAQVSVGLDTQTRNILIVGGAALIGLLAWRMFKRG